SRKHDCKRRRSSRPVRLNSYGPAEICYALAWSGGDFGREGRRSKNVLGNELTIARSPRRDGGGRCGLGKVDHRSEDALRGPARAPCPAYRCRRDVWSTPNVLPHANTIALSVKS